MVEYTSHRLATLISTEAAKVVAAVLLAYPLSGAAYAIYLMVGDVLKYHRLDPGLDVLMVFFWMVFVPLYGGFVPANDAGIGPPINMYPWIIPIAVMLYFLFSFLLSRYLPLFQDHPDQ